VTSFGFCAERATDATTHIWRSRENNKSKTEGGDGDWVAEFPWAICHSAQEAMDMLREEGQFRREGIPWIPFGAQGPIPQGMFWDVPHHAEPKVSVVVEIGEAYSDDEMINTLDSLNLNPFVDWECFVDGLREGKKIPGALWAAPLNGNMPKGRVMRIRAGHILTSGELESFAK